MHAGKRAEVGVRYSSPFFTSGAIVTPATNQLANLWVAGRQNGITGVNLQVLQ